MWGCVMPENPIRCNGKEVLAILENKKSQMRRVIKPQPTNVGSSNLDRFEYWNDAWHPTSPSGKVGVFSPYEYKCPYGVPGDTLWVRECFKPYCRMGELYTFQYKADNAFSKEYEMLKIDYEHKSDEEVFDDRWRPSIHMPRWASRINLLVKDIRVERVQDISEEDALAEGTPGAWIIGENDLHHRENPNKAHRFFFSRLWDKINSKRGFGWDVNPWVWVVEFEVK